MSDVGTIDRDGYGTATTNLKSAMGIASGLVFVNIALILLLSYTPVADLGLVLFSNFFLGIGAFVVTVGGGHWLSRSALEDGNTALAGVGVVAIQFGYGLIGSALLSLVGSGLRVPVLGATAVVTAALTAVVTAVVFNVDHSFRRWNYYATGLFVGGFAMGAAGVFVSPLLLAVASVAFFLGFVVYLAHEIWAVKTSDRGGTMVHAIGIYVAVMGVFIHILKWIIRLMSILDQ